MTNPPSQIEVKEPPPGSGRRLTQDIVIRLVARLREVQCKKTGRYLEILRLGLEEDTRTYAKLLRKAGLEAGPTSRIKRILSCKKARMRLRSEESVSFRSLLALASGAKRVQASSQTDSQTPKKISSGPKAPDIFAEVDLLHGLCARLRRSKNWPATDRFDCGIFTLRFNANGAPRRKNPNLANADAEERFHGASEMPHPLRVIVTPEAAEILSSVARFSSLRRERAAAELIARKRKALLRLENLFANVVSARLLSPFTGPLTAQEKKGGAVPLHRGKTSCPDVVLLRLDLRSATREIIDRIGSITGLAPEEVASRLLGPRPYSWFFKVVRARRRALDHRGVFISDESGPRTGPLARLYQERVMLERSKRIRS